MDPLYIVLIILASLIFLILLTSFICFMKVFFIPSRKPLKEGEYAFPPGKIYEPFYEDMKTWTNQIRTMNHEIIKIKSDDNLTLVGSYYKCKKGAPIELMFHGYQGNAERDLCGGVIRAFALERNVIIINHRASGPSQGHITTFGIKERKDCLKWIEYAVNRFGENVELHLTGVSMGAATVIMAGGENIPSNVKSILADCGYSSAKEVICKTVKEMHLPPKIFYPFIKLGAFIFGHFNIDETSPIKALEKCKTPIIFMHGDIDDIVPLQMSIDMYNKVSSIKKLGIIKNAGHGLAYPADKELYVNILKEFEKEYQK